MNKYKILPLEAIGFSIIVISAFATRFLSIPWDPGGFFFQLWVSVLSFACFFQLLPRMKRLPRLFAKLIVVPIAGFIVFGSIYFAPQALFPFMFVGFTATGVFWLWSQAKVLSAFLVGLLLLPLFVYCLYGARHIALLTHLRLLDGKAVREVFFKPTAEADKSIVINDPTDVTSIAESLAWTSPYSPNHEGIVNPWYCTIVLVDGSNIYFRVGKGNRVHTDTVWIQFGVEVYQNPTLYRVLQKQNIRLWNHDSDSTQGIAG